MAVLDENVAFKTTETTKGWIAEEDCWRKSIFCEDKEGKPLSVEDYQKAIGVLALNKKANLHVSQGGPSMPLLGNSIQKVVAFLGLEPIVAHFEGYCIIQHKSHNEGTNQKLFVILALCALTTIISM